MRAVVNLLALVASLAGCGDAAAAFWMIEGIACAALCLVRELRRTDG